MVQIAHFCHQFKNILDPFAGGLLNLEWLFALICVTLATRAQHGLRQHHHYLAHPNRIVNVLHSRVRGGVIYLDPPLT